ncbi:MAG: FMN-binding protein [Rhodoglobus sp.]|nr:FMN-binding protein [Rhodoglobus sp.]
MRTRALLGSIFGSVAVLVIGWQAGEAVLASSSTTISEPQASGTTGDTTGGTAGGTGTTSPTSPDATPTETPVASGPSDGTYTGSSVATRFGDVQVAVTVANGTITDVTAVQLTDADGRSVQISNRAAPMLRDEVLASQSARVANVSGATYTTQAYLSSVQSALDAAGF